MTLVCKFYYQYFSPIQTTQQPFYHRILLPILGYILKGYKSWDNSE